MVTLYNAGYPINTFYLIDKNIHKKYFIEEICIYNKQGILISTRFLIEKNNNKIEQIHFGSENSSVAFIKNTKPYKLIRKIKLNFDNTFFYMPIKAHQRSFKSCRACRLYIPEEVFNINYLGKQYSYHNTYKEFFDSYELAYENYTFLVKTKFERKEIPENIEFLSDFIKIIKASCNKISIHESFFQKLDEEYKNSLLKELQNFIDTYKTFIPIK